MTPVQDILTIQYFYASANAAINRINKILDLKRNKWSIRARFKS